MMCADAVGASPPRAKALTARRRGWRMQAVLLLTLIAGRGIETTGAAETARTTRATLHYAPNHNFDASGVWRPATAGFNLADINDPRQLRDLPMGVKALVWIGLCSGADRKFVDVITPYVKEKAIFGFYLMDDPDPRIGLAQCKPSSLRAEADWIHAHVRGARTFIVLMNLSAAETPSFQGTYNPSNSHVDLYGIDPYPCRSELNGCSNTMIPRYVLAAETWGISRARMVPVYQTFGGGSWSDGDGGKYRLPTAAQSRAMLAQWRALVPAPPFDCAYSWGVQRGDHALEDSADLRDVFSNHNKDR
jgi:hypothetical protein